MEELHFRSHFAETIAGRDALARLIDDVFSVDVTPLNRLGHDPSVVPFGWWHGEDLVANVSLYQRRLWLSGTPTAAFGVQSVAVRPAWRGKGLFRDLMERALAYADERAGLIILSTGTPDLYAPFGFRPLGETVSTGWQMPLPGRTNSRRLSLDDDADTALLRDLFARRMPVSLAASACDHPALFMLRTVASPDIALFHLPDLDAVVAIGNADRQPLTLLDIVAADVPSLEAIVSALGHDGGEVRVMLTTDRLAWTPRETETISNGHMVRGAFPPEDSAFMLTDMTI